jgi:hypothetical protein
LGAKIGRIIDIRKFLSHGYYKGHTDITDNTDFFIIETRSALPLCLQRMRIMRIMIIIEKKTGKTLLDVWSSCRALVLNAIPLSLRTSS